MKASTAPLLACPVRRPKKRCGGSLRPWPQGVDEILSGRLTCEDCEAEFPILGGVAVVVEDVHSYLVHHVKGITQHIPDSQIPAEYLEDFCQARDELPEEHLEEDLEAERVNALYFMNHYLRVHSSPAEPFWAPRAGNGSPLIDELVRAHWDSGPFSVIERWLHETKVQWRPPSFDLVEVGCGVGGLHRALAGLYSRYLGVDSSFASIVLARHIALGAPWKQGKIASVHIPEDLLQGPVGREVFIPKAEGSLKGGAEIDFIVGDLEGHPLREKIADCSIALNTIDMLEFPQRLPALQKEMLRPHGIAIQSCPYIWHERVSKRLRSTLPKTVKTSAAAAEALYEREGFRILKREPEIPWLFFKHVRQLEIYSVHAFLSVLSTET